MSDWAYLDLMSHLDRLGEARVRPGLDRISAACVRLGNPQLAAPVIHIAGTNGKGSTGAFLRTLMSGLGLRIGHYTSPHLIDFAERIWVNGEPISHERLAEIGENVFRLCGDFSLTYFEFATAMAFVAFMQSRIDCAIVEVGLGGRLDATNIVRPKVCVLTPLGMDHISLLGDSPAAIAREKCGIIKEGVPVISAPQAGEVMEVIRHVCAERHAPLTVASPVAENIALGLPGAHQRMNAGVALATAQIAFPSPHLGRGQGEGGMQQLLATAVWPGRCEWLSHNPPVIFDGAHNVHGAEALASYIRDIRNGRRVVCALGVLRDKDARGIIDALSPVVDRFVAVTPPHPRALPAEELAALIRAQGRQVELCDFVEQALRMHTHIHSQFFVITGSLTLYADAVASISPNG